MVELQLDGAASLNGLARAYGILSRYCWVGVAATYCAASYPFGSPVCQKEGEIEGFPLDDGLVLSYSVIADDVALSLRPLGVTVA
jgi:hypothetical protein